MNVFITTGTYDFLKTIKNKHPKENMVMMDGATGAALLHETNGKTVFATPRRFEVVDGIGTIVPRGYVVINNIPVTDEGRPLFEHRFKNRAGTVENEPGFLSLRILRPIKSNTYVVFTQWENSEAYEKWKSSDSYQQAHKKRPANDGINDQPHIFSGASYLSIYTIPEDDQ